MENQIREEINPKSMDEIKSLIEKHQRKPGSEAKSYSLLIEGFDIIKSKLEYNEKLRDAGNISVEVQAGGWINNMVRDMIGGSIVASKLVIEWKIDGKIIEYNPYDGVLRHAG